MKEKSGIQKLEIADFTNAEIRPGRKEEPKTIAVNAHPGWYSGAYEKAKSAIRTVRKTLSFREKDADKEGGTVRSLLFKTAICACIALLLLLVKNIDSPFTNTVSEGVQSVLENNTDLEKEIGRLKFVQNIFGSEPVLSEINGSAYVNPVSEGKVIKKFGDGGGKGVTIESVKNCPVFSVEAGKIKKLMKEENGTVLRLLLDDGTEVVYTGISPRVSEGDNIKKGGVLGTLKGSALEFEVYRSGKAVDPLDFLSKRSALKE